MGRFSITVHVKTKDNGAGFIDLFRDIMSKRGFAECPADEAEMTYFLAFGGGGWATLASERYMDSGSGYDDAEKLAAELKTAAVVAEVVDSDFATLKLYLSDGSMDVVLIGDASGYGIDNPPKPKRSLWETLITTDEDWERFCGIAQKGSVFVEDTLYEIAPVPGIASKYICADYRDFTENEDYKATAMYFKN
ncbi:MAG: hypothetical protein HDR72_04800 [Ruminococcaceae bacterium]|nr:hypothetical protein [Oscillospiraceae bacterium]